MRLNKILLLLMLAVPVACSTSEKKSGGGGGGGDDIGGGGKGGKDEKGGGAEASATRVTFTNSLSNNTLTSETINSGKAESELQKFEAGGKDKRAIEGRISAQRLAKKSSSEVLGSAKRLAEIEMEKGAGKTVGDEVKLEIALSALQSRNFALAEYFLQELMTESKNARVKAGAFNAMGVIALHDDRVPEAVLYFKEALKAVSNYKPALLNIGFAALKGGDVAAAKNALGGMQNDWFVQYGLITVARIEGNEGNAKELCDNVLKKEPGHGGALFNCGLFEYQNKHNIPKAKEYLSRAGKAHGEPGWGEKAFTLIAQIDKEEAEVKQKAAAQKAASAAAAAAAKAKAKAPAAPAGGAAGAGGAPAVEQKPQQ